MDPGITHHGRLRLFRCPGSTFCVTTNGPTNEGLAPSSFHFVLEEASGIAVLDDIHTENSKEVRLRRWHRYAG